MSLRSTLRFSRLLSAPLLVLATLIVWSPNAKADEEFVTVTLTIRVTDQSGKPVAKAHISIQRKGHNARNQALGTIDDETNARGEYTRATDFQLTGVPHKVAAGAGNITIEQPLSDEQLREASKHKDHSLLVQIALNPEKPRLTISGTVTDQSGAPISSAVVSLVKQSKASDDHEPRLTATTGPDGRFELSNVEFDTGDRSGSLKIIASNFDDREFALTADLLNKISNNHLTLNPIQLVAAQSSPPLSQQLKDIVDFLLWLIGLIFVLAMVAYLVYWAYQWRRGRTGSRVGLQKQVPPKVLLGKIYRDVGEIKDFMLTEGKLRSTLTEMLKEPLQKKGEDELTSTSQTDRFIPENELVPPPSRIQSTGVHVRTARDSQSVAKEAYQNLVNKIPIDQEPVYLGVEGPRSAGGKLEDKTVYLTQVNHSNAALVLFTEDNKTGWLFPNPKLAFSTAAVKDVFPDLTEMDYETRKFYLDPGPAVRVDEGRWKIVSS